MKRLLPISLTLLILSSAPAYAEWAAVGSSENGGGVTVYADRDTIRRKGDLVKMWYLSDFKTIQTVAGNSYLSSKLQDEYDCTEERHRLLTYTDFSGNMGSGTVGYSNSPENKWEPVQPKSIGQTLWEVACNKQ